MGRRNAAETGRARRDGGRAGPRGSSATGAADTERLATTLGEDGVIRISFPPDCVVGVRDVESFLARLDVLSPDSPALLLVDLTGFRQMEPDARRALSARVGEGAAAALFGGTSVARALARIVVGLSSKKDYPMRFFADEAGALAWLLSLRAEPGRPSGGGAS